jgi:hypothetical protein
LKLIRGLLGLAFVAALLVMPMVLGTVSVWPKPNNSGWNPFVDGWNTEIFYVIVGSVFLLLLARMVHEIYDAISLTTKTQRRYEINLGPGERMNIGPISGHGGARVTIRLDMFEEKKCNTIEVQLQCGDSHSVSPASGVLVESPSMVDRTLEMRIRTKDAWSHDLFVTCLRASLPAMDICLSVQVASKTASVLPDAVISTDLS